MTSLYGAWAGDTFVTKGSDLMTVRPNGNLEIRGKGWGRRSSKNPDAVRVCRLKSVASARQVAEMVAEILYGPQAEVAT